MPAVTASAATTRSLTVALLGNPNTGKSTLFNALAGVRQRVGNYPGVTVEKKIGRAELRGRPVDLVDLPGTYSLAARSPDEMVTVDVLLGRRGDVPPIDAVLCIVDANNLERNLYLVSQALDLGLPTVVALNMTDIAEQHGVHIDVDRLARQLGVPVVPIQAHRRIGLDPLRSALLATIDQRAAQPTAAPRESPFPPVFRAEVDALHERLSATSPLPRFLAERLLLDTSGHIERGIVDGAAGGLHEALGAARQRLEQAGHPVPAVEAVSRYAWVARVVAGVTQRRPTEKANLTDRIDRVLCHWLFGSLTFVALMALMFQAVFTWAGPLMEGIEASVGWLGERAAAMLPPGAVRSLVVEGVLGGVGAVVVFLPQIAILFLFIALLEDCGYMARAAFLMDKLMVPVGLSGKSFIPLLSSFACAIPGVMAARVIENRRDRLATILIAPLMSCSARLPVYTIMISAFIPDVAYVRLNVPLLGESTLLGLQGLTMFAMYLVGIAAAVFVAWVLRRTFLRGETPPFVMELPTYKWPSPQTVFFRIVDRCWGFLRRAGTLILAISIVIWATLYYPRRAEVEHRNLAEQAAIDQQLASLPEDAPARGELDRRRAELEQALSEPDAEALSQMQRESLLGHAGHAIEPLVKPLGWDWRIGCAAIASFPAREVVVATLGVIFSQGSDVDIEEEEAREGLQAALAEAIWDENAGDRAGQPLFTIPVALSLMVFFALCAQCAATLAVIKRETNSWRWPAFSFAYMTILAYFAALATYQIGTWLLS